MEFSARKLSEFGVDIIIYDSSNDSRTEATVINFNIEGCNNVIYDRWTGKWDGVSLDRKVMDAYKKYCERYDYIWAHRDGLLINPEGMERAILPLLEENLDLIVVNTLCRDIEGIGNRKYTKSSELFRDQCMQMTVLGATIVKGNIIKDIVNEIPLESGKTYGLWQPMAFFYYFNDRPFSAKSIVDDIWLANSGAPSSSFWKKNTMHQWCGMWYEMIMNLPEVYDRAKKDVLKVKMSDFHPFTVHNLLGLRSVGGLNIKMVNKYRKRLPYICDTSESSFYIVSIIPRCLVSYVGVRFENGISKIGKVYQAIFCNYVDEGWLLND